MSTPHDDFFDEPPAGGYGPEPGSGEPFSEFSGDPKGETAYTEAAAQPVEQESDGGAFGDETQASVTKCPNCGANMVYDSEKSALYCEHCDTTLSVDADNSEEQAFENLLRGDNAWGSESYVVRCENCGAQTVFEKGTIATACPFCGATNIVDSEELPGLRPNAVVPFRLGKENATERVKKWAHKKIFAPRRFRKSAKPEEMAGVYMPAFTFDANTFAVYRAVLGKYYYTTRRVNGRTERVRHTRYFTVSGHYSKMFDDVLVQATSQLDQKSLNALQPFNTNESKEYTQEYLSGFIATQCSKNGLACWEDAKKTMRSRLRNEILSRYTYDVVSSFDMNMQCSNITYKYMLLPVYVGHCNWRKKLYNFFVNGYNGKVTGKTPVSPVKVGVLVVFIAAVLVGLYFLYKYFSG